MSLLYIPKDSINGGVVRNYKKNALHKIMQYKIILNTLNTTYQSDTVFYITKLREIFDKLEFLGGTTDYQLLYDAIILNNFLSEQLDNINFEYQINYLLNKFNIINPLIKSLKYLINKEIENIKVEELIKEVKKYLLDNKITLVLQYKFPDIEKYKNKFYEEMESIKPQDFSKDITLQSVVITLQSNLNQYVSMLDILTEYISELELFYINLASNLYKYKKISNKTLSI